jgi:urease accessory protein UreF
MQMDDLSGVEFFRIARQQQNACAQNTAAGLPELGKSAPECHAQLGSALNGAAGCRWGYSDGDHLIGYLLGSAASSAQAANRLLVHGFHDENLAHFRSTGELANLLILFGRKPRAFIDCRAASRRERLTNH